jgi:replicative DNA helicase
MIAVVARWLTASRISPRSLSVPVIVLAQLNRGVESRDDNRRVMSDPRESGGIEQAADIVGLLYREEVYDRQTLKRGITECHFAKCRRGETATCMWSFAGQDSRVTDCTPSECRRRPARGMWESG